MNSLGWCWISIEGIKSHHHHINACIHSDTHEPFIRGIPHHVWPEAITVHSLRQWRNLIVPRTAAGLVSGTVKHLTNHKVRPTCHMTDGSAVFWRLQRKGKTQANKWGVIVELRLTPLFHKLKLIWKLIWSFDVWHFLLYNCSSKCYHNRKTSVMNWCSFSFLQWCKAG